MGERAGLTVKGALWTMAFIALGLAALLEPATFEGVLSVGLTGFVLFGLAAYLDRSAPTDPANRGVGRFASLTYLAAAVVEAFGAVATHLLDNDRMVLWYLLGMGFAICGLIAARIRGPHDSVAAAQLFFHGMIVLPLLAALVVLLFDHQEGPRISRFPSMRATMGLTAFVVTIVGVPLIFVTLLTVLGLNASRPTRERSTAWAVLTAHEALFIVMMARWVARSV